MADLVESGESEGAARGERVARAYVEALNAGDAEAVLALFAPGAEVEDPMGTPVKHGAEIEAFYRGAVTVAPELEIDGPVRGSADGRSVAFAFRVRTRRKNGAFETHSIDVLRLDAHGRIERLEGHWGAENRREFAPSER